MLRKSLDADDRLCNNFYMNNRKTNTDTLTTALRRAINDSDLPFLQLEQQTGVLRQVLMKFARGEQSMRLDMADKLAKFFDLSLQPNPKPKRSTK